MFYSLAASLIVLLHFVFIIFVVAGGFLVKKYHWLAAVHLPAVTWAVLLEFNGWICPLTPLEKSLREAAGKAGYQGGFVEHYLLPIIYPANLDVPMQVVLGSFVIVVNVALYAWILIGYYTKKKGASERT